MCVCVCEIVWVGGCARTCARVCACVCVCLYLCAFVYEYLVCTEPTRRARRIANPHEHNVILMTARIDTYRQRGSVGLR